MNTHEQVIREGGAGAAPERSTLKFAVGGTTAEAIGGLAAAVLAIIGLARILPSDMAAIATIVVGAAFLSEGLSAGARLARFASEGAAGGEFAGTGYTSEFLGGATAIVLGILAILGISPQVLLPVSAIVLGGSLLLGSGLSSGFQRFTGGVGHSEAYWAVASFSGLGPRLFVGIGAIVLGIIGVVGASWMVLTLVSMLGLGISVFLIGVSVGGRMTSSLQ